MEDKKSAPVTMSPGDGKTLSVMGGTYRLLVTGKETDGAFATIEMIIPPGGGPGPHAHPDFQETFYVIEGEVEVKSEAGTYIAKKGAYVVIPKGGIVHCFKNKSDKIANLLCTVVPSGLEEMFLEVGQPVALGDFLPPPVMDAEMIKKLTEIAEKYGQKVFPPNYLG